ncbi:MAG: hypothetical protein ACOYWZ_05315 [Bacillota bacterium]
MDKMSDNIKRLIKRPGILLAFSFVTLVFCVFEYIFFFPVVLGISSIRSGNTLDSMMHVIQLVTSLVSNIKYLIYGLAALVLTGLFSGLILSGPFYLLNNFLSKRARMKGEFWKGIKKHFVRLSFISTSVVVYTFLFAIFMAIVSVPAIAVTRSFISGNSKLLIVTIVFDVITLGVLFFGFTFFRLYMLFWYPAALNFKGRFFAIGKYAADTYFWKIVSGLILFDMVFLLFEFILIYLNSSLSAGEYTDIARVFILIFINWIFKTVFFILLTVFTFSKFLLFKSRLVKG